MEIIKSDKETKLEKISILNIATILPFPEKNNTYLLKENDFLITLGNYLQAEGIEYHYLKLVNYSNKYLGKISEKWAAYNFIPEEYTVKNRAIKTMKKIAFPKDKFKALSTILTIFYNRKRLLKLQSSGYTCTHAHYLLVDGFVSYYLFKKTGLPYILTVRNETKYFKKIFLSILAKKVLNNAKYILTTNEVNKKKLLKYTNKKIFVIPHGVDENNFHLNLNTSNPIKIITVCKLDKGKRVDLLIKALSKIKNVNFCLQIIGMGSEYEYLKSIIKDIKCEFLGELPHDQVICNLKKSDIFVLPSESESFGRVYIEALASSNAVVAVKNTGVYGLFYEDHEIMYMEKNSESSLYNILNVLLNNKSKVNSLKRNGYLSVKDTYSWQSISTKYKNIYIDVSKSLQEGAKIAKNSDNS